MNDEVDINPLFKLIGSVVIGFGMNANGEIYLNTNRGDRFLIAKDETGEIALYEIEKKKP